MLFWRILLELRTIRSVFRMVVPAYPCGLGATETSLGLVRFAGLIWDWQDEPESLILAQSERWRHA